MNRRNVITAQVFCLAIIGALTTCLTGLAQEPVSSLLPLHVQRNKILDSEGKQKVLRGVSISDPYLLKEVDNQLLEKHFEVLATDWNASIVRVPIYPGLWKLSDDYLKEYVDPIVKWGGKHGMYILLAWNGHGNPITGEVEPTPWANKAPWPEDPFNPDLELAKSALGAMAERYRDTPWVIYGTFSEPSYITWDEWQPVAEDLVDAVQSIHPSALVMVSGVQWGFDMSSVLNKPIDRPNVVYEMHPYSWFGDDWKINNDQLESNYNFYAFSGTYPVFMGEWGYSLSLRAALTVTGKYPLEMYAQQLMKFCRDRKIGWTAWGWNQQPLDQKFVGLGKYGWHLGSLFMFESLDNYTTTTYGAFVKNALNQPEP
jgi:cellulase (glycosyl hydrolase family 5)